MGELSPCIQATQRSIEGGRSTTGRQVMKGDGSAPTQLGTIDSPIPAPTSVAMAMVREQSCTVPTLIPARRSAVVTVPE